MLIKSITTLLLFNYYLDLMRAGWMAQVVLLYLHSFRSPHLLQINARRGEEGRGGGTPPCPLTHTRGSHAPSTGPHSARTQPPLSWSCRRTTQSTRNSGIRTHSHIPPPSVEQPARNSRAGDSVLSHPDSTPRDGGQREDTLDLTLLKV